MSSNLAKTALHACHAAYGGRMVDFAGWSMPVQYTSIVEEHNATRNAVGVFDVSHMGRLRFEGPDVAAFLDSTVTRRVTDMKPGAIRYALVTNEDGGILDDVLVYCVAGQGEPGYQMVVNASNRAKIVAWLHDHADPTDIEIVDRTSETVMIAVQGPRALELLQPLVDVTLAEMSYYSGQNATIASGTPCFISRTGYTGEDGCELIFEAESGPAIWETILAAGESLGAKPAGLASRDTLRLEAGMPLYGHELSEQINPVQAGLGFAYNLKDRQFIGRDAIVRFKNDPSLPRRIGLELSSRRVPREGYAILSDDRPVGEVTSGTFSPTLERPIAMGYAEPSVAETGTQLAVEIRGRREPATVVSLPFYKRKA